METLDRLAAGHLRAVVTTYRDALRAHQEAVNRLNVYPVPDGDTGTNMALTLEEVVKEVAVAEDMTATCKAIGHGALMGARGNSGIILSQILRAVAEECKGLDAAGPLDVAAGLTHAAEVAYEAVMRPVEGTILTVVREAAEAARVAAGTGGTLVDVLDAAKAAGADSLARTPELLPVLKQAGVVDAGGAGFLLLLDAFLHVAAGRPLPEPPAVLAGPLRMETVLDAAHEVAGDLRYEVMYLLEAPDETIPAFKDVWAGIGDSIVVVGGDGIWNCHVHTDDIGAAIEAAMDCGRPRSIRVTDLHEQVEEERWVREAAASAQEPEQHHEPVPTAVIAVGTGEGIRRIFHSLGVQKVVAGGQSMNPSTAQILEAVEAAPGEQVVILPNNKNIVPVAEQVGPLTTKPVAVVPTTGIAEGFAALLEYDPQATAADNAAAMAECSQRVVSGEVTRAIRASDSEAGPIEEGDWLGLSSKRIEHVGETLADAACGLLDRLVVLDEHEIVTIIEGEGSSAADTRRITEWLAEHRPEVAAEVHHGGQPLYPYLFSIE